MRVSYPCKCLKKFGHLFSNYVVATSNVSRAILQARLMIVIEFANNDRKPNSENIIGVCYDISSEKKALS